MVTCGCEDEILGEVEVAGSGERRDDLVGGRRTRAGDGRRVAGRGGAGQWRRRANEP